MLFNESAVFWVICQLQANCLAQAACVGAFAARAWALPLGSVGYENATNERGERHLRLEPHVVAKLKYLRGPGESYSDVIIRLADHSERAKP